MSNSHYDQSRDDHSDHACDDAFAGANCTTGKKFSNPHTTASGDRRACVSIAELKTVWFCTGTLCNIACEHCYIESSPRNNRLSYLKHDEVLAYLDEIRQESYPVEEIAITGGEPFMNPDIIPILEECLQRDFRLLVLTNAMRPMMRPAIQKALVNLQKTYKSRLTLRVSVDHFKPEHHEEERGPNSWEVVIKGLQWLSANGFSLDIAGRTRWETSEELLREGFADLFAEYGINVNAHDKKQLLLFPEMDATANVPEITTQCWDILNVNPQDIMCASARMVVKHHGDHKPSVMACTLLPYDRAFNMGSTLRASMQPVALNHPHCAKFCVLGGGACSIV